jgi:hypothetical protein
MLSKAQIALCAAILSVLSCELPAAERVFQVIENSYESTTDSVDLPVTAPGRLSLRPCSECPMELLSISTASRFFLAQQEVTYPEFRAFVDKNSRGLMVHYDPKTKVVTRLRVPG